MPLRVHLTEVGIFCAAAVTVAGAHSRRREEKCVHAGRACCDCLESTLKRAYMALRDLLFSRRMTLNCQFHWSRVESALQNITDSRNEGEAPSAVLKAPRSTVGPTEHPMGLGLLRSDPLAPRLRN